MSTSSEALFCISATEWDIDSVIFNKNKIQLRKRVEFACKIRID